MKKNSRKLYGKYKNRIVDIVLFGSYVKGKLNPEDIDMTIILKNSNNSFAEKLYIEFKELFGKHTHYNWILVENLFEESLFPTLLEEGISLIKNEKLHKILGYRSSYIFSFYLKNLSKSKKVLFSYALHGKNNEKGILNTLKGEQFGRAVIIIPIEHSEEFREFLETWDIQYKAKKVLMK